MTHPTDEELDTLVFALDHLHPDDISSRDCSDAITTLRARVAEVQGWFEHEQEMHQITMGERDHALAALDEAKEETKDAISTLEAWFDRRELGHKAVDQAVLDAASGYLRTSRSGGMPQKKSDLVLAVFQDMARLGVFADLFARAAKTQVEAALAAQIEVAAWQPIETAPRDGSWFVARTKFGTIRVVHYADCADRYPIAHDDKAWSTAPTEWMPISFRAQPHDTTALDRVKAEARAQGEKDEREACAKVCDEMGAREQANFGLGRETQNYFRARDAIRARGGEA